MDPITHPSQNPYYQPTFVPQYFGRGSDTTPVVGPTGPTGPTGPSGPTGPPGPSLLSSASIALVNDLNITLPVAVPNNGKIPYNQFLTNDTSSYNLVNGTLVIDPSGTYLINITVNTVETSSILETSLVPPQNPIVVNGNQFNLTGVYSFDTPPQALISILNISGDNITVQNSQISIVRVGPAIPP